MKISQISTTLLLAFALSGCLTLSGVYTVIAVDDNGKNLMPNVDMIAEGSGIYTIRNAFCSQFPGATIKITDRQTGAELTSESPYKCRGKLKQSSNP